MLAQRNGCCCLISQSHYRPNPYNLPIQLHCRNSQNYWSAASVLMEATLWLGQMTIPAISGAGMCFGPLPNKSLAALHLTFRRALLLRDRRDWRPCLHHCSLARGLDILNLSSSYNSAMMATHLQLAPRMEPRGYVLHFLVCKEEGNFILASACICVYILRRR